MNKFFLFDELIITSPAILRAHLALAKAKGIKVKRLKLRLTDPKHWKGYPRRAES